MRDSDDLDPKALSRLIGLIYDATLDPGLWTQALEECCRFLPGCTAKVFSQDAVRKVPGAYHIWGCEPEFIALYFERYAKMSPLFPQTLFMNIGEVCSCYDLVPFDEFRASRFHKEWLEPQGVVDAIASVLDKSATSCAVFAISRGAPHGLVDQTARERMALIVPHVRRAMVIGDVIEHIKVEASALADVLDRIAAGVFVVTKDAGLLHVNASGRAMLEDGSPVRSVAGRLSPWDLAVERTLADIFSAAGIGDRAVGVRGTAIPMRGRDDGEYVAHVLPLTSKRRQAGAGAVAAVFLRKAAMDMVSPIEAISKVYRLTPAELRVLFAIVEIGDVVAVAEMLGITEATARTHLRNIFPKTNTHGQADLVRLVASYMSPLTGPASD